MERIPYRDVEYVVQHLKDNQQIHINHTECSAGADSKVRLYIKKIDNRILAYCHNCGLHGLWYADTSGLRLLAPRGLSKVLESLEKETKESGGKVVMPHDSVPIDCVTQKGVSEYLAVKGLSEEHATMWRWKYSPSLGRLIMPVYNDEGRIMFWQGRQIDGAGPKYINSPGVPKPLFFSSYANWHLKTLVIVEDIASAVRIHHSTHIKHVSCALLGTQLPDDFAHQTDEFRTIIVWMDNDKPGREASREIGNRLITTHKARTYEVHKSTPQATQLNDDKIRNVLSRLHT